MVAFNLSSDIKSNNSTLLIFTLNSLVLKVSLEVVRVTALIASLVNMRVLVSIKFNILVHRLFAIMAAVDSVYISMLFLLRITYLYCEPSPDLICPRVHFIFNMAHIWISDYATSCMALFNILLEIFITLQRLFTVSNHLPSIKNISKVKLVCIIIFIISFSAYLPVLFMKRVELKPEQNPQSAVKQYWLIKTEFGKSKAATNIMNLLNVSRVFLFSFVLLVLNFMTVFRFRRFLKRCSMYSENTRSNFNKNYTITCRYI
jgi:hypothetical protein